MTTARSLRFAVVGLDHGHAFQHVEGLMPAGAEFAGYCDKTSVPALADAFREQFPEVPIRNRDDIFADDSIDIICISAVPADRADLAIRAMRAGKDVMVDKPGVTTFAQLDAVRQTVAETGRIFSVCFSERHSVPAAVRAGQLIAEGAIGTVVQTVGLGPHRKSLPTRPDWYYDPERFGGIIVDIASHQIDQFLFYTGSATADVAASTIGNFTMPDKPGFEDFGEVLLRSDKAAGYIRVDWLTPDGLPSWGDGRLTILGTKGYIELRKYVDIAGRAGDNHLFLVDGNGVSHMDCSDVPLVYFDQFVADVRNRTETAMTQAHVYEVCRLSLEAQRMATRITPR